MLPYWVRYMSNSERKRLKLVDLRIFAVKVFVFVFLQFPLGNSRFFDLQNNNSNDNDNNNNNNVILPTKPSRKIFSGFLQCLRKPGFLSSLRPSSCLTLPVIVESFLTNSLSSECGLLWWECGQMEVWLIFTMQSNSHVAIHVLFLCEKDTHRSKSKRNAAYLQF